MVTTEAAWQSLYYVGQKSRSDFSTQRPFYSAGGVRTIRFSAVLRRHCAYHLASSYFVDGETEARRGQVPMPYVPQLACGRSESRLQTS